MPASATVRKTTATTVNHPSVFRPHRVPMPGKTGTDGYRHEFAGIAKGFALLGTTQAALADLFGIHEDTIANWKRAPPSFAGRSRKAANMPTASLPTRSSGVASASRCRR